MGLDTILMHSAAAGAMSAISPCSATFKADGFIVGVVYCGVTAERVTLKNTNDPSWEQDGIIIEPSGNGGVQDAPNLNPWLSHKIPVKSGTTLSATSVGAGDHHMLVYVEYPSIGPAFSPRKPLEGISKLSSRTVTCGGALTALTARFVDDTITDFLADINYMPVAITPVTGGTGPEIVVGFKDISNDNRWLQFIPLTEVLLSGVWRTLIPHGYNAIKGGNATFYMFFFSETTDTPAIQVLFSRS